LLADGTRVSTTTAQTISDLPSARDRILEQALVLFAKRGFADVSMKEIAEAVGITKAALYYHFTGKEALFASSFAHEVDLVRSQIAEIASQSADLFTAVRDLALFFLERGPRDMRRLHQDFVSFVSEEQRDQLFPGGSPEMILLHTMSGFFENQQANGQIRPDIDVTTLFSVIFGMIHAQVRIQKRLRPTGGEIKSNEQIATGIAEIVLYGVVPRPE
jgi:AcrR family transcriptional regulator